jgi:hypothetical protein
MWVPSWSWNGMLRGGGGCLLDKRTDVSNCKTGRCEHRGGGRAGAWAAEARKGGEETQCLSVSVSVCVCVCLRLRLRLCVE